MVETYWSTIGRHLLSQNVFSFITFLKMKPNLVYQDSAWWPLNRGDKNGRTLVGTANRWPWLLNRGGCFIEVLFSILFYNNNYFGTLITGCLMEDGQLIGDCLMEARLYTWSLTWQSWRHNGLACKEYFLCGKSCLSYV